MKIFGNPLSTRTRQVLTTLHETQTPYEWVMVDFTTGEHKQAHHLARQPFGQVPALTDDGFTLFESHAMCRYINDKAGGQLIPKDLKERALMEQWMSIEASNFTPHTMKFIYHHLMRNSQDEAILAHAQAQLETTLGIMDSHLTHHEYFAADRFTLADIFFMPYLGYCMMTPVKETLAKYPAVMAWWNRVSERPTWRKACEMA